MTKYNQASHKGNMSYMVSFCCLSRFSMWVSELGFYLDSWISWICECGMRFYQQFVELVTKMLLLGKNGM